MHYALLTFHYTNIVTSSHPWVVADAVDRILGLVLAMVVVFGYMLGSIPSAQIVARRFGINDLRAVGDLNPGYWNLATQVGHRRAWPAAIGDSAKGLIAAGLGAAALGVWPGAYVGAGAAIVGHAFPVFARWRGGRSVLAFTGASVVLSPLSFTVSIGVLFVVWMGRPRRQLRFEWAVWAAFAAYPLAQLIVDGPRLTAATGVLMTFIGVRFVTAARTK